MPADADARFTIRSYQPGDEAAILELFERSFHVMRSLEHWRWKFELDPYGARRISVAFDNDGRLVAQYCGYAVRFFLNGANADANQIGDTMTEPSIRHIGRGPTSILGRTALHFYENFCEGKVAFNYGFNVANIQKFSLRFLRSDRVEPIAYRSIDVATLKPVSRLEKWARGIQLELVREVDGAWDRLLARAAPAYRFLVRRDAEYVRWRYLSCPDIEYAVVAIRKWRHLVGWLVFRVRGDRLTIGDLFVDPDHVDVIGLTVRHLAGVYPVQEIEGWFAARPPWLDDALRSAGFERRPEPQDLSLMCVAFTRPDATESMRRALYYTMGDSDLF